MTQNIKNFMEEGEKELMNLKCVNGAMYFGSVEDDSCNCTTRCENEQTFEHATEELKQFISSRQISLIKMIIKMIENEQKCALNEAFDIYIKKEDILSKLKGIIKE